MNAKPEDRIKRGASSKLLWLSYKVTRTGIHLGLDTEQRLLEKPRDLPTKHI